MLFVTCLRCHRTFGRLVGVAHSYLCPLCAAEEAWRTSTVVAPPPSRAV
jgi:hypothetical protein